MASRYPYLQRHEREDADFKLSRRDAELYSVKNAPQVHVNRAALIVKNFRGWQQSSKMHLSVDDGLDVHQTFIFFIY